MDNVIERKYLVHLLDANFNSDPSKTGLTFNWVRLGEDLESYAIELNPQVEIRKNIKGEQKVFHSGYETQSSVDTFYAYEGEPLFEKLSDIVNNRLTGEGCRTSHIDALMHVDKTTKALVCDWAWRENCKVVPQSMGGDTTGVQIPFNIMDEGHRKEGTLSQDADGNWSFTAN